MLRLCRPFYRWLHRFRKEWDIKTSLIGAFATFYLLCYVKILNVTADIMSEKLLSHLGQNESSQIMFPYYNASISFFGTQHLPYAVCALLISLIFNFCPILLLCVYPCEPFSQIQSQNSTNLLVHECTWGGAEKHNTKTQRTQHSNYHDFKYDCIISNNIVHSFSPESFPNHHWEISPKSTNYAR